MANITIRKAGVIYVIVFLLVASTYYYSLSSQEEFLREKRWVSDNSALNLVLENEVLLLYTFSHSDLRQKLPTTYRISNNTTSVPIGDEEEFLRSLDAFKDHIDTSVVPQDVIDEYFDDVMENYYYDEFQYTAAITTINLELILEYLTVLGPNIPPIIDHTEKTYVTLHAVSIIENNIWRVKFLVEEDENGVFVVPDSSLLRYLKFEQTSE